jgi:hypothetical protein
VDGHENHKKTDKLLSEAQLLEAVKSCFDSQYTAEFGEGITAEALCNELCKRVGHKTYRASMKPWKKFQRFIEHFSDHFIIRDDGIIYLKNDISNTEGDASVNTNSTAHGSSTFEDDTAADSKADSITFDGVAASDKADINHHVNPVKNVLSSTKAFEYIYPMPEISFIEGDIFASIQWWEDADVIYAASLLFTEDMMTHLTSLLAKTKSGSWIITLKPLLFEDVGGELDDFFNLKNESFYRMSWQMAKVYIYQRR